MARATNTVTPGSYRQFCARCIQPQFSCFCSYIRRFDPKIKFVILTHPIEYRRRIATGWMSKLCLENAELIQGQNYSHDKRVNELMNDTKFYCVVLGLGPSATNVTELTPEERSQRFPTNKKLLIFVIDGTWATSKKTLKQSENLATLPRICFSPPVPSSFRVRRQPSEHCYSTIEAIHETIELLGASQGFDFQKRTHDSLLAVFNKVIEREIQCVEMAQARSVTTTLRRVQRT